MENSSGWKYYNHGLIPNCLPHEKPELEEIHSGNIWKKAPRGTFLIRWTEDFDQGKEMPWWYVIKDTPFEIQKLDANTRYKINKGKKRFRVVQIDPKEHVGEIYGVQVAAYSQYPEKYRPAVDRDRLAESICRHWISDNVFVYAAYFRETDQFAGYTFLERNGNCLELSAQKVMPEYEKHQINASLIANILEIWEPFLREGGYICDGARNIQHETAFQDYLERYFGFRKAYCRLFVEYNPKIRWMIPLLYLGRPIVRKLDGLSLFHKINGVLQMEEIIRIQRKQSG